MVIKVAERLELNKTVIEYDTFEVWPDGVIHLDKLSKLSHCHITLHERAPETEHWVEGEGEIAHCFVQLKGSGWPVKVVTDA